MQGGHRARYRGWPHSSTKKGSCPSSQTTSPSSRSWYRKSQSKKGVRAAQQAPITQNHLANIKAGKIRILLVSFAFVALDATVLQLHTEVSDASWFQGQGLAESGHYLPTRPSSLRAITWLLHRYLLTKNGAKAPRSPNRWSANHQIPGNTVPVCTNNPCF